MKHRLLTISLAFSLILLSGCAANEAPPKPVVLPESTPAATSSTEPQTSPAETESAEIPPEETEEQAPETEEILSVRLVCAGDNLIHSPIYAQAARRAEEGYDFSPVYEDVSEIISSADLAVLNQETIISDDFEPSTYPCFCTPTEMGEEMAALGFDAVSISNNHLLDKGEKGLLSTLDYWHTNHPEIALYGAFAGETQIPTLEVNGITFAFVGFMEHTNGLSLPSGSECSITYLSELDEVERQVRLADELADCVIVSPHYGIEVSGEVTQSQLYMTQLLGDWGADIIIGTQPHTVQPMEYFRTARGTDAFVFYCLGNFVSAMSNPLSMVGMLGEITVNKNAETGEITLSDAGAIPIITQYGSGFDNIRICQWSSYTRELAAAHGCSGFSYDFAEDLINSKVVICDLLDKPEEMTEAADN